jgi:hypothetical protein
MKYILLLIVITGFAFTYQRDIKPLLCDKTWYMGYVRIGDSVVRVPEEIPLEQRPTAYFHMNGVFENNMEGRNKKGTWRYDEAKKELTTVEESKITAVMKLVYLTKDTLELITPDKMTMGLIHRKKLNPK